MLLNPGRAKPSELGILKEGVIEKHKVDIDPTMRQMVKLVEKVYNTNELNGRVYIYNSIVEQI
ncbi:hypothetical protein [Oceanobacillus massiliensis]|uniref:hypothetical protein n=1 Tax=Oceanobacillus massiliensis TaxID=1465765 RepID=UPI00301A4398